MLALTYLAQYKNLTMYKCLKRININHFCTNFVKYGCNHISVYCRMHFYTWWRRLHAYIICDSLCNKRVNFIWFSTYIFLSNILIEKMNTKCVLSKSLFNRKITCYFDILYRICKYVPPHIQRMLFKEISNFCCTNCRCAIITISWSVHVHRSFFLRYLYSKVVKPLTDKELTPITIKNPLKFKLIF